MIKIHLEYDVCVSRASDPMSRRCMISRGERIRIRIVPNGSTLGGGRLGGIGSWKKKQA